MKKAAHFTRVCSVKNQETILRIAKEFGFDLTILGTQIDDDGNNLRSERKRFVSFLAEKTFGCQPSTIEVYVCTLISRGFCGSESFMSHISRLYNAKIEEKKKQNQAMENARMRMRVRNAFKRFDKTTLFALLRGTPSILNEHEKKEYKKAQRLKRQFDSQTMVKSQISQLCGVR